MNHKVQVTIGIDKKSHTMKGEISTKLLRLLEKRDIDGTKEIILCLTQTILDRWNDEK